MHQSRPLALVPALPVPLPGGAPAPQEAAVASGVEPSEPEAALTP